jgi:hypothetical protein
MSSGFVYLFTNDAMPGIVKIGFTRGTLKERKKSLVTTGVPGKFEIEFAISSLQPEILEKKIHKHLRKYRYSKEFFKCELTILIREIKLYLEEEQEFYIEYEGRASNLYLTKKDIKDIEDREKKVKELQEKKNTEIREKKIKKIEEINLEKERQELINNLANTWEVEYVEILRSISVDFIKNRQKYRETITGKYQNRSKLWDVGLGISTFFVGNYILWKIDDSIENIDIAITKNYTYEQALKIKKFLELELLVEKDTSEFNLLKKHEGLLELKRRFERRYTNVYKSSNSDFNFNRVLEYVLKHHQIKIEEETTQIKFVCKLSKFGLHSIDDKWTIPMDFIKISNETKEIFVDYKNRKFCIPFSVVKNTAEFLDS